MESAYPRAVRGHITRRGKAWRVHVYLGRDEKTGKDRYLTRTVRGTKREAENVCAALVAQASQGQFSKSAGTMGELLELWMDHIEPNVSPATLAAYRIYLDRWILRKTHTPFDARHAVAVVPPTDEDYAAEKLRQSRASSL